jgi:parvulin-like peptidyl-prolyl isomerase
VARRLSRDPSARRGGFQGELGREDLPPAFAEALFALAPGELSGVLEAAYGFHVFQVTARLPLHQLTLAEAEPEIRATLERESADRALEALVAEARRRYTLDVYVRNLPFRYRAAPPLPAS